MCKCDRRSTTIKRKTWQKYCKIFKIFENEKIIDALYNKDPIFTKYIEFKYLNYKSTKILIFEIKDMSEFEKLLTHN